MKRIKAVGADATMGPAERLCLQMGVPPDRQIFKTKAMEMFSLEAFHLSDLQYTSKVTMQNKDGQASATNVAIRIAEV